MKRRTLVVGLGSATLGGSILVGTGAFSSVDADRAITVETADDAEAFLRLVPRGDGGRSGTDDDLLTFRLPSALEQLDSQDSPNPNNPGGLGGDSVYRFGSDAGADDPPLFEAQNRGTQPVRVYGTPEAAPDKPSVRIYDTGTGEVLTEANPSELLEPGESLGLGLQIDTHGVDVGRLHETSVTIHAATEDELSR